MILGFQGKLQGKLGRSRVNSRGKLSPIWSIFCHYVAHKKPHQANTYPLGLLRWHGGLRCPLCAVYNPPPKPYGELNRPNIMNHGTQSWIQNSNQFGFARVNHACGMPHASTSFEYGKYGCCIQWSMYATKFSTKFSTVALTECACVKYFEDCEIIFMR